MTQNIEQRTEAAVSKYEGAASKAKQFAETDSTVTTEAGLRKSFPKLSREIEGYALESLRLGSANNQGTYAVGVSFDIPNWTYTYKGQQWGLSDNFDLSLLPYEATQSDPNNDDNLSPYGSASTRYVNQAQSEGIGGSICPEEGVLASGVPVPSGTTRLRVLVEGKPKIVAFFPVVSGIVDSISDTGATIGGISVEFTQWRENRYFTSPSKSAIENMLSDFNANELSRVVGVISKAGLSDWEFLDSTGPITLENFRALSAIAVFDFGIKPGPSYSVKNCDAYAKLAKYINKIGGNVSVYWPASNEPYEFSPKDNSNFNSVDDSWRIAVELVDVENVYHVGYGATIYQRADPTWFRGNSNTGLNASSEGVDESPIQFRSTTQDGCIKVGVKGLEIKTDLVTPADSGYPDGETFGIAYRGCSRTLTENVIVYGFGTDNIYYGTDYDNSFKGRHHTLINPTLDKAFRQGISVVGNDHGEIFGGSITNTGGSSFGYAIDFETNGNVHQEDWTIYSLHTQNNAYGACNHIRSSKIHWIDCTLDEQSKASTNTGCTRFDGSLTPETLTSDIKFIRCDITGYRATIYAVGDYVDDVEYQDCNLKCTGDVSTDAQIRINANLKANVGEFKITGGTIKGNGGIAARGVEGGLDTKVSLRGIKWHPSDEGATTPEWTIDTGSEFVDFEMIDSELDFTKGNWTATGTVTPHIVEGLVRDNKFKSTSGYVVEFKDYGAGRQVKLGFNEWSDYAFYKGVTNGLDVKHPAGIQTTDKVGAHFGNYYRVVHGGRKRVIDFNNNPSVFEGEQAPRNGDVTHEVSGSGASEHHLSYVYRGSLGRWQLHSSYIGLGSSQARPTTIGTEINDTGLQYLDTTLNPNGQLITWSGANWVSPTGAVV